MNFTIFLFRGMEFKRISNKKNNAILFSLLLIFGSVKKINFFKWPWIILTFYILIGCLVGIILRYGLF